MLRIRTASTWLLASRVRSFHRFAPEHHVTNSQCAFLPPTHKAPQIRPLDIAASVVSHPVATGLTGRFNETTNLNPFTLTARLSTDKALSTGASLRSSPVPNKRGHGFYRGGASRNSATISDNQRRLKRRRMESNQSFRFTRSAAHQCSLSKSGCLSAPSSHCKFVGVPSDVSRSQASIKQHEPS